MDNLKYDATVVDAAIAAINTKLGYAPGVEFKPALGGYSQQPLPIFFEQNRKAEQAAVATDTPIPDTKWAKLIWDMRERFGARPFENVYVVFLNRDGEVMTKRTMAKGDEKSTRVPIPDIMETCQMLGCNDIIMMHNHPDGGIYTGSGEPQPSQTDLESTFSYYQLLPIKIEDHIVVSDLGVASVRHVFKEIGETV